MLQKSKRKFQLNLLDNGVLNMTKYLQIGQIVNTFGIKGMVKIKPFTDDIKRFDRLETIYIENKKVKKEYEIEEVKYHKNMVLMKLKRY